MTEELKELGLNVGHRRVGRLMRQNEVSVIRTRQDYEPKQQKLNKAAV